jgi:hypothetical protein
MLEKLANFVLPQWVLPVVVAVAFSLYSAWVWHKGDEHGTAKLHAYQAEQMSKGIKLIQARTIVVDRVVEKYIQGKTTIITQIEHLTKEIPVYVTKSDDAACPIRNGFVRAYNAAWSGDDPGAAVETDRESSGVPLSEIAETTAHNAGSCRQWREQALALRLAYEQVRLAKP